MSRRDLIDRMVLDHLPARLNAGEIEQVIKLLDNKISPLLCFDCGDALFELFICYGHYQAAW